MITRLILFAVIMIQLTVSVACRTRRDDDKKTDERMAERSGAVASDPDVSVYEAALNGDLSQVKGLLNGGFHVNAEDEEGRTALMYAAYNGHIEIMKSLLDKGALVNLTDTNGRTALMLASSGPYPAAVNLLLDHNADPDVADKDEHYTALMFAAAEGQLDVVKVLLSRRAAPLLRDIDGDNARTFAENNGHKEIATLLRAFEK